MMNQGIQIWDQVWRETDFFNLVTMANDLHSKKVHVSSFTIHLIPSWHEAVVLESSQVIHLNKLGELLTTGY